MINKYFLLALTSLGFSSCFVSNGLAQFVPIEVKPAPVKSVYVAENYKPELASLIRIQGVQQKISVLEDVYKNLESEKTQKDIADKRYQAMEQCNIKRLASVYKDPALAWQNITKKYDEQELKLSVDIMNATPKKLSTGEELRTEQLAYWQLGKEVLTEVYATPEKFGEVKDGQSFPLWEDQKYLYTAEVTAFITSVNSALGRMGRIPGVSSVNSYAKNAEAFAAFLKTLTPQQLAKLPQKLQVFPATPKALPPAQEIMHYFENPAQSKSVFPQWPEPWKEFIKSDFEKYNPNGEMAQEFRPKSLVLKDEVKHRNPVNQNNRLHVYQALKKEKEMAQKDFETIQNLQKTTIDSVSSDLKGLNVDMPIDADDFTTVEKIQEQLKSKKTAYINSVRAKITKNQEANPPLNLNNESQQLQNLAKMPYGKQMAYLRTLDKSSEEYAKAKTIIAGAQESEYLQYLDALEKDAVGEIALATTNASSIDHLKKEKDAENALKQEIRNKQQQEYRKAYSKKIDENCLNGGM